MDLLNVLDHKRGTRVAVDGTVYEIGNDGVVNGVADAHAQKLLQNAKVWKVHDPKRASAVRAQAKKELRGSMRLLDTHGNPVTPPPDKPGDPVDPMMDVYKRQMADGPPPVLPVQDELPETDQAPPETDQALPETDQAVGQEPPLPMAEEVAEDAEDEWPDPDESMDVEYLREMASAYEVSFNVRTPKKTLVKRIQAAMYE
jgi:hypothetical protein